MRFNETDFTIFDFETTGLYPFAGDKICEIGAIRIGPDGEVAGKFHSLVDPRRPISYGAFRVNGISDAMVRGQPTIDTILPKFMHFIDKSVLVAYNAGFDLGFLEYALGHARDTLGSFYVVDALKLARRVFPHVERYNLGAVSHSLGICSAIEHRAMADAFATMKVFQKALEVLTADGITTIEEISLPRREASSHRRTDEQERIRLIEEAIRARRRVAITYFSIWNNAMTKRTITPHSIQKTGDTAYVVAHCHLRDELRNFRLDCVVDVWNEDRTS